MSDLLALAHRVYRTTWLMDTRSEAFGIPTLAQLVMETQELAEAAASAMSAEILESTKDMRITMGVWDVTPESPETGLGAPLPHDRVEGEEVDAGYPNAALEGEDGE